MEEHNVSFVSEKLPGQCRKRQRQKDTWKCKQEQALRYSAKCLPEYPKKCSHVGTTLKCQTLTMQDIKRFHAQFYKDSNKIRQDQFLVRFCKITKPARNRQRKRKVTKPKEKTVFYFIRNRQNEEVRVCKATFLGVLNIGKNRLDGVINRFNDTGVTSENRGGDRKTLLFDQKFQAVKKFIKRLKADESHYCRGKSTRQYLPAELNISKLYKMYQQQQDNTELKVKFNYFYNVFSKYFNVGFGSPKTDACSLCIELTEKIKIETDVTKKNELMVQKRVHKLRSRAFFDLLKEEREDLITFSYDCEKNLVLPKIPDQIAYYSRQLYCYNFCVVKGSSKSSLTTDNVFIYSWLENESLKGSNEIASAVFNCLKRNEVTMTNVNKNCTVLTMCIKWLHEAPSNIKEVQIIFPVTGHSYMPPDRVFGIIEKKLKKMDTITQSEEYHKIFKEQGSLFLLGEDWTVQNWKKESETNIKPPAALPFKISQIKRLILTRNRNNNIKVSGEMNYRTNLQNPTVIFKKNRTIPQINPAEIKIGVPIKSQKLKDIKNLLTRHFGSEWSKLPQCTLYTTLRDGTESNEENINNDVCEYVEESLPI